MVDEKGIECCKRCKGLSIWLKKQIKETESLITEDLLFPDFLYTRKRAFEDVLRWLDDR